MSRSNLPRLSYIDVLKILATFLIIFLHVSALYVDMNLRPLDAPALAPYVINGYTRIALPMFMMMSGVLLLREQYKFKFAKKFFFILNNYIIWALIFMLGKQLGCYLSGAPLLTPAQMLVTWIRGPYHFWYLLMLMGFYILMPVLSKLKDLQTLTYTLLLVFVLNYILRPFTPYFPECLQYILSNLTLVTPNNVLFYFLLGAWIARLPHHQNLAIISGLALGLGVSLRAYQLSHAPTLAGALAMPFFNDYSELLMAGAVLYMLKFICRNYHASQAVQTLSKHTLRIFIISPLLIFTYDFLLQDRIDAVFPYYGVTIFLTTVVVFVGTTLIAVILAKKDRRVQALKEKLLHRD
ncbi:MAG: acyltransferase [Peptococcaceae bacterium]|nr:acyltransferase [Peptococcaceae bacterium]